MGLYYSHIIIWINDCSFVIYCWFHFATTFCWSSLEDMESVTTFIISSIHSPVSFDAWVFWILVKSFRFLFLINLPSLGFNSPSTYIVGEIRVIIKCLVIFYRSTMFAMFGKLSAKLYISLAAWLFISEGVMCCFFFFLFFYLLFFFLCVTLIAFLSFVCSFLLSPFFPSLSTSLTLLSPTSQLIF